MKEQMQRGVFIFHPWLRKVKCLTPHHITFYECTQNNWTCEKVRKHFMADTHDDLDCFQSLQCFNAGLLECDLGVPV